MWPLTLEFNFIQLIGQPPVGIKGAAVVLVSTEALRLQMDMYSYPQWKLYQNPDRKENMGQ